MPTAYSKRSELIRATRDYCAREFARLSGRAWTKADADELRAEEKDIELEKRARMAIEELREAALAVRSLSRSSGRNQSVLEALDLARRLSAEGPVLDLLHGWHLETKPTWSSSASRTFLLYRLASTEEQSRTRMKERNRTLYQRTAGDRRPWSWHRGISGELVGINRKLSQKELAIISILVGHVPDLPKDLLTTGGIRVSEVLQRERRALKQAMRRQFD